MKGAFEAMMPYIEDQLARGTRLHSITRHFVGAFHGVPGARAFRRHLAENGVKADAGVNVLRDAMALVDDQAVKRGLAQGDPSGRELLVEESVNAD
jgi:tRNA-dihydrouridine synthase A